MGNFLATRPALTASSSGRHLRISADRRRHGALSCRSASNPDAEHLQSATRELDALTESFCQMCVVSGGLHLGVPEQLADQREALALRQSARSKGVV